MRHVLKFTKDGKSILYDVNEIDPRRQVTGDAEMVRAFTEVLTGPGVVVVEPDGYVEFREELPVRNAVITAISMGFDLEGDPSNDLPKTPSAEDGAANPLVVRPSAEDETSAPEPSAPWPKAVAVDAATESEGLSAFDHEEAVPVEFVDAGEDAPEVADEAVDPVEVAAEPVAEDEGDVPAEVTDEAADVAADEDEGDVPNEVTYEAADEDEGDYPSEDAYEPPAGFTEAELSDDDDGPDEYDDPPEDAYEPPAGFTEAELSDDDEKLAYGEDADDSAYDEDVFEPVEPTEDELSELTGIRVDATEAPQPAPEGLLGLLGSGAGFTESADHEYPKGYLDHLGDSPRAE